MEDFVCTDWFGDYWSLRFCAPASVGAFFVFKGEFYGEISILFLMYWQIFLNLKRWERDFK